METTAVLKKEELTAEFVHSISSSIYPFVVGLMHADDLVGSGTLVQVGSKRGILTAYHVLHDIHPKFDFKAGSADTLGLILLTERPHRFEIPLGIGLVTPVDIAKPTVAELGPDLAFIEIRPSHYLDELLARRDFFNLATKRTERAKMNLDHREGMVVSGFYHEGHTVEENVEGFASIKGFNGFAGLTTIQRRLEHDGFDLCEVTVDYSITERIPKDFGGYSGGGLWNVILTRDNSGRLSHEFPIFAGVVFYQENKGPKRKILRCHLNRSIYQQAFEMISNATAP